MKKRFIVRVATVILLAILFAGMIPQSILMAASNEGDHEAYLNETQPETQEMLRENLAEEETEESTDIEEIDDAFGYEGMEFFTTDVDQAGEVERIRPEYDETSYRKDTFFPQTTMQGIFSDCELYFYIPEYWETKYVYVELEYRVSQLMQNVDSSMTFYVNQIPISSYAINYEDGDSQIAYVRIPTEMVREGYNSLLVMAYARLTDEEGCASAYSNANWLSISDTSYIRCGYEVKDIGYEIAYYPYPFLSTIDETGQGLTIAVSDDATNEEVAAAMNLMADLSGQTVSDNLIQFTMLSDLKLTESNRTILVSEYDNLPDAYREKVANISGIEDQGIVAFTNDSQGNPLLIITSKDKKCLMEAVYMLMDESRVSQEKGNVAQVMAGSADLIMEMSEADQMVAGNYTLGDFSGGGLNFVGLFHQEQMIYLPFSEDYYLSESGRITLYFRYSDNLDFNKSLITVYWGNVPIISKKLDREKASGDEMTFTMPADMAGTSAGAIRIAFDLELEDMACSFKQDQMPWAYVSDKSQFYLPASSRYELSFDAMPSPFRMNGRFNDVLMIIPDQPASDELNVYAQIVGMYGAGVEPYGTFDVKRTSEFTESDADYNIITVGTYENNNFLRKLNDHLPFSFNGSGNSFESNEQLILSNDYANSIAIMQLIESPYAEGRGVLALTGATEETLAYAEALMRKEVLHYNLSKDCVIIDQELETRAFQFIRRSSENAKPTLAETLDHNKQSILFTIVATSVMLMLLIAVIIILIRIKIYHKKQDEERY